MSDRERERERDVTVPTAKARHEVHAANGKCIAQGGTTGGATTKFRVTRPTNE